ncbi:MAG TPA: SET domain-containing protein [Isosphaeraceae bacterium]
MAGAGPPEHDGSQPAPRGLEVRTPPGRVRGVYTTHPIAAGEVVEVAPTLLIDASECLLIDQTALADYYFVWPKGGQGGAIAFGYASLYNHSYRPNVDYHRDHAAQTLVFTALRAIAAGEQLTINYNGSPGDLTPVWFEPDGT